MGVFKSIKTVGRYQYLLLGINTLQIFINCICNGGVLFVVPDLDFNCQVKKVVTNTSSPISSFGNQCSKTIPYGNDSSFIDGTFLNQSLLVANKDKMSINLPCRNVTFDHSQFTYTATEKYSLICDRKWLTTFAGTAYLVGYFFGGLLSGMTCDRFGRKKVIQSACILGICNQLLAIFAPSFIIYLVSRSLFAVVEMFVWLPIMTLILELVRPEQRIIINSIDAFNYDVIFAVVAAVNFVLSNYIHMHYLAIALQTSLFVLVSIFLHESPKWLVVQKRSNDAESVVTKIADFNKVHVKKLQHLLHPEVVLKRANISDLFRTPVTKRRTLILVVVWQCIVFLMYGILYNMGEFSTNVRLSVIIMGVIETPGIIPITLATNKFGRQIMLFSLVLLCGLCCFIMVGFEKGSIALMILAIVGKFMISSAFSILYLHTQEIYCTQTRNTGLGFCVTVARFASFLSPQVRLLNQFWAKSSVVLLGSMSIVAALCIPALPDTTGYELPSTLESGETFQAWHKYALRLPPKITNLDQQQVPHVPSYTRELVTADNTVAL